MPEYLFENVAATPYAKTLAMHAGLALSAFVPHAHGYLTGADIAAGPKPVAAPEPVVVVTPEPSSLKEPANDEPAELISPVVRAGNPITPIASDLVMPAPAPEKPAIRIFEPIAGQGDTRQRDRPSVLSAGQDRRPVPLSCDVAVIGGGPAGYTAALRAAELGAKVILFEKDEIGGADLYRGRIPMKAYLKTSGQLRQAREAGERGISIPADAIPDMKRCLASKDKLVAKLAKGIAEQLASAGVIFVNTRAALVNEHTVFSGVGVFSVGKVILCGGSEPFLPSLPGMEHPCVITSDEIFTMKKIPKQLVIFGGGAIGCQAAAVFSAFGSRVLLIERQSRVLPYADAKTSEGVRQVLLASGVRLYTGVPVLGVTDAGGRPCVESGRGGVECDLVLAAVGRRPNLLCRGNLDGQIALEDSAVKVNGAMETSVPGIYAAGDFVRSAIRFSGVTEMARVAAENAVAAEKRQAAVDI
ncbi:hypothetical protein AGMMS49983_04150 [Clostridia bacterium]|nr:hypothetical protein AGMMS49983_04150 [Clostridia bacterium]